MAHDVFISYSSQDKAVADAVCARLESRKIRCWIAPRDVQPGQPFAASLINAINASRVVVLVLSAGSNQSAHVLREVGEAVDNGIPIVPLRIEDVEPSEEMRYYIKSLHWLDAMSPPLERHLDKLASSVQALLAVGDGAPTAPVETLVEVPAQKRQALPTWGIILIGIIAIIVLAGGVIWALTRQGSASPANPTPASALLDIETDTPVPTSATVETEWKSLDFIIPNETLWSQTEDSYTVIARPASETIAWSDELISGDFVLTAEVTHPSPQGIVLIIVYGDGIGFSDGCLVFHYGNGFVGIMKDTIYESGDNDLMWNQGDFYIHESGREIKIEITGGKVNVYADGQKIAFTFLPPNINHEGRIGLVQDYGSLVGPTFSNIRIKSLDEIQ